MPRYLWLTVGLMALAGCSEKPRPIQEAKAIRANEADATVALPKGEPPEKSDPTATRLIAEAVAAHTDGKPELLEKLRAIDVERTGFGTTPSPAGGMVWRVRAVWPDHYRTDVSYASNAALRQIVGRAGENVWQAVIPLAPNKERIPPGSILKGVLADYTYEWLMVLAPLVEPDLVATAVPDTTVNGRPAAGVWLSSPNLPRAVAHFDKETKLLAQFTYEGHEAGSDLIKEVKVTSYKTVNGVKLPEKLAIKWGGRPAVEWTVTKIEFPVELPPQVFEEP